MTTTEALGCSTRPFGEAVRSAPDTLHRTRSERGACISRATVPRSHGDQDSRECATGETKVSLAALFLLKLASV